MKRHSLFRTLLLLIVGCTAPVFAQTTADVPSIEPAFIYTPQTDNAELSPQDIITAALAFSECPPDSEEGQTVLAAFERIQNAVSQPDFLQMPPAQRGEAVLELLYRDVLKRYQENESRIHTMFSKGIYNCVSSSILYLAAARAAGLTVSGQKTPDHAFCTLHLETGDIDVETTNPYGFNPGSKKEITASDQNATSYAYIPKRKYANRETVSDRVFVGLVGGNLSISYMNRNQYNAAIPLAAARYVFLDGETSAAAQTVRSEFDITCTNYIIQLQRKKEYEKSLDWASSALQRWGMTGTWQTAVNTAVYNTVAAFLNERDILQAENCFAQWQPHLSADTQKSIKNAVFITVLTEATKNLPPDETLTYLRQASAQPEALDKNIQKLITDIGVSAWSQKALNAANAQSFLEAAEILQQGLSEYQNNAQLKKLRDQCLQNYAIQVHNQITTLFSQERYAEAKTLAEQGLSSVPSNKLLQTDLSKINQLLKK